MPLYTMDGHLLQWKSYAGVSVDGVCPNTTRLRLISGSYGLLSVNVQGPIADIYNVWKRGILRLLKSVLFGRRWTATDKWQD